jgi:catechol 2,3-dioxygenase-like lactoylglutathione lyase family enzyme
MTVRLAVVSILVRDIDKALEFYTQKLGFERIADLPTGDGGHSVTVAPQGERYLQIALTEPDPHVQGEAVAKALLKQVGHGTRWVFFTNDCRGTYETWKARGVKFLSNPTITPYGMEADFEDLYGNVFSLIEPTPQVLATFVEH